MRVAIVGAGALGSVYAARLAWFGSCEVSVVARSPGPAYVQRLERVEDGDVLQWGVPARVTTPPRDADVIAVFVRTEHLTELPERLKASPAPVVVLTPMLPADHARLAAALPGRVVAAMPGVVAYRNEAGAIRYWLPRVATTLIEARSPAGAELELASRLERSGLKARLTPDVLERDVATTVSFIPLAMALDVAGSIPALLGDKALLRLALDAAAEGRALGRAVGKPEPWAPLLLRFVGPRSLKVAVSLARGRYPEAVAYVEHHFGRKLHAQNTAMAEGMVQLARERGTPSDALDKLLARLRAAA